MTFPSAQILTALMLTLESRILNQNKNHFFSKSEMKEEIYKGTEDMGKKGKERYFKKGAKTVWDSPSLIWKTFLLPTKEKKERTAKGMFQQNNWFVIVEGNGKFRNRSSIFECLLQKEE